MKRTSESVNKALSSKNILFIEAIYDDYGNNSRIHYLEAGCVTSCLAGGIGPRDYIKRMMRTRCLSETIYRQYMTKWLGMEKGYPYLAGAGALMVPVKTRVSVKFTDNRRNYDDAYSFYRQHLSRRRFCDQNLPERQPERAGVRTGPDGAGGVSADLGSAGLKKQPVPARYPLNCAGFYCVS